MNRNKQVLRLMETLQMLEQAPHGLSVQEILSRLNEKKIKTGARTVYRDIEALSSIYSITSKEKTETGSERFAIETTTKITKYLALHPRELFALYFARGMLQPLQNTPFYTDIQGIFKKIDNLLGQRGREFLEELSSSVFFEPTPKWGLGIGQETLETVRAACEERHTLEGIYVSTKDNEPRKRSLGPQFLYYAKGGIYLVAEDLVSGGIKTYSLPRFHSINMTTTAYDKMPVDPSDFFASSFGVFSATEVENVELEIEAPIARYITERQWHASQRVVNLEKGRTRVSFSVALTPEFVSWVLGFGANVRVTQSDKLIKQLVLQASKVREMYWKKAG